MKALEIKKSIFWVGAFDPQLKLFDLLMPLQFGTTYNSYLILDEKIVLIDTVKKGFSEEWLDHIRSVTAPEKIDYIIANHFELDHAGNLMTILNLAPNAKIIISKNGEAFLKNTFNNDFKDRFISMNDGDELNLGSRTIKFFKAPFLHWPDTLFDYLVEDEILFSADAFGAHFCDKRVFNDYADDYSKDFEYYYQVIMSPFKQFVLDALNKIKDLKISILCPAHGPVVRRDADDLIKKYRDWSTLPHSEKIKVFIAYASIYGSTRKIAESIAEGLEDNDVKVILYDVVYDKDKYKNLAYQLDQMDCIIIGSPTILGAPIHPVWEFLSELIMINKREKFAGAFTSYGWSGEALSIIQNILKDFRFKLLDDGLKINFIPSPEQEKQCLEWGKKTADLLKEKIKKGSK